MEILKASVNDCNIIYSIAVPAWNAAYTTILSAEQMEYMLELMYSREAITEQISVKGHQFLLVYNEQVAVGFASYEVNVKYETTKLHKLYVLPEVKGAGYGRALVNAVAGMAKKHTNDKLILNVNRRNPSVGFYKNMGFTIAGEEDITIGNGYLMEDYIMQKQL